MKKIVGIISAIVVVIMLFRFCCTNGFIGGRGDCDNYF